MTKTISMVIPAYNEEETIIRCIQSCYNQSVQPMEVIVVNNMSTDSTKQVVLDYKQENNLKNLIVLDQNKVQGRSQTRDVGFNYAKGDVIGRIDADSMLSRTWIEVVRNAFDKEKIAASTGPVSYYDMPLRKVSLFGDNISRLLTNRALGKWIPIYGANMAILKSAWDKIKDEIHEDKGDLYHEDIDIGLHLVENNLKIKYIPKMIGIISARRIQDPFKEYRDYIHRFRRTYKLHGLDSKKMRFPEYLLLIMWTWLNPLGKVYKRKYNLSVALDDQLIVYTRRQRKKLQQISR